MAINFQQTDTAATFPNDHCTVDADCTGLTSGRECSDGGSAGSTAVSPAPTIVASVGRVVRAFKCVVDSGVSWDAGTWTVRMNVTTANMNLEIDRLWICRIDSSGNSQAQIGDSDTLSSPISLASTGVKSQTVSGSAQSPSAGDVVWVLVRVNNGAMSTQSFTFTPDQLIDSPFNVAAVPLATKPVIVRQAVNRAATY